MKSVRKQMFIVQLLPSRLPLQPQLFKKTMLQVPFLRENKEEVITGLAKRNHLDAKERIENVLNLDEQRKKTQTELDELLSRANSIAKEIGDLFKSGRASEAGELKAETAGI